MAERFNYTGRVTIESSHVHVTLVDKGGHKSFRAAVDFAEYDFPSSARVFIEAYIKNHLIRFDFGTVGTFAAPVDTSLDAFGDDALSILYRVKVVADDERRTILGMPNRGRGVHAENGEGSAPDCLLPVNNLPESSEQVWALDYSKDFPRLLINRDVDKQARGSDVFVALVYPAALRGVLEYTFLLHFDGHGCAWADDWRQFAAENMSEPFPDIADYSEVDDDYIELVSTWIDNVVEAFVADTGLVKKVNEVAK